MVGLPMSFSKTPGIAVRNSAPGLGEHTEEVLQNLLGYSKKEVAELQSKKII